MYHKITSLEESCASSLVSSRTKRQEVCLKLFIGTNTLLGGNAVDGILQDGLGVSGVVCGGQFKVVKATQMRPQSFGIAELVLFASAHHSSHDVQMTQTMCPGLTLGPQDVVATTPLVGPLVVLRPSGVLRVKALQIYVVPPLPPQHVPAVMKLGLGGIPGVIGLLIHDFGGNP